MDEIAIGANFKGAAARWNERERFDSFAKFENFRRQTDGLRRVISNHAIFNRYFGFHLILLPGNGTKRARKGQEPSLHAPRALRPAAGRTGGERTAWCKCHEGATSDPRRGCRTDRCAVIRHPLPA